MVNLLDATNPFKMTGQKKNPFSDSGITKKVEKANVSTNTSTNSLPTPQSIEVKPTRESTSLLIKPLPAITAPSTPKKSLIDFSSIMPQPGRFDPLAQAKVGTRMPEIQNITAGPTQQDRVQSQVGVQNALDVRREKKNTMDSAVKDFITDTFQAPDVSIDEIRVDYPEFEGVDSSVLRELGATLYENPDMQLTEIQQLFPEIYGEDFKYEKPNTSRMGGIKGNLASNGINLGLGEWVNPIGKVVEIVDDVVQKIPTLSTEEWDTYAKENLGGFGEGMGAVPTMVVNAIPSFLKTISGTSRGVTNPADTMTGLYTLLSTEEGHQVLKDRYGGTEQLARTMTEDPVGLASDILTVVGGGSSVLGKAGQWSGKATGLSNLSNAGTKLSQFGNTAMNVADMGINAGLINKGIDLLPTKGLQRAANVITAPISPNEKIVQPLVNKLKPNMNKLSEGLVASTFKQPAMREKYISKVGQAPEVTLLEAGIKGTLENQTKLVLKKASESADFARRQASKIPDTVKSAEGAWITSKLIEGIDESIPGIKDKIKPIVDMNERFKNGQATTNDLIDAKTFLSRYEQIYDDFGRVKKTGDAFEKEALASMYTTLKTQVEDLGSKYDVDMEKINYDTMKFEGLRGLMTRAISREANKDILGLSDYVLGGYGAIVDPVSALVVLGGKKLLQSPNISSNIANSLYTKQGDNFISNMKKNDTNISTNSMNSPNTKVIKNAIKDTPALPQKSEGYNLGTNKNPIKLNPNPLKDITEINPFKGKKPTDTLPSPFKETPTKKVITTQEKKVVSPFKKEPLAKTAEPTATTKLVDGDVIKDIDGGYKAIYQGADGINIQKNNEYVGKIQFDYGKDYLEPYPNYVGIRRVEIDPKFQGKGLGKELYKVALDNLPEGKKGIVGINEYIRNERVGSIYKSLGGKQDNKGNRILEKKPISPFKKSSVPSKESTEKLAKSEKTSTIDTMSNKTLIQEARKYKSADEFIDSKMSKGYRTVHQVDTKTASSITDIKEDVIDSFTKSFRDQYGYPALKTKEVERLKKIMSNPDADITIYRASPKNELNSGDRVTVDKDYANDIKRQNGGTVHKYTVKAKDLFYPKTKEGFEDLPSLSKWSSFQYQDTNNISQLRKIREEANK